MRLSPTLALVCASTLALVAGCASVTGEMTTEPLMAEPVPATAGSWLTPTAPSERGSYSGIVRRGVVTAGDIDDRLNLAAFSRYVKRAAQTLRLPHLGLGAPVMVRLTGPDGSSAPGARYTLRRPGAAEAFYQGYAGPDGWIVDFPAVLGAGGQGAVELRVFDDSGQEVARETVKTGRTTQVSLPQGAEWRPDFLDLVLVVDSTGSMGDEIAFLRRELIGITRAAARKAPGLSIRYGLVAYRDDGDEYVVKNYGFTEKSGTMAGWLRGLSADGGGDYPEAVASAMSQAVGLDWRRGKGERLVLHVADAPPHDRDAGAYLRTAGVAAEKGVQIFTLGASGVGSEAEYLMRQASAASGGRYLFLTDDSGVGAVHGEPTITCYQVTKLSRLLTRVLMTELSGHRQEADSGEVLREVGSYSGGVCLD